MEKEEFDRIADLFEEIFELMEYAASRINNIPLENNRTADAIHMLDKIKSELNI